MSGQRSSTLPGRETLDSASMTFEERLQMGADNAVRCMGVGASDRVFIITDFEREHIARLVAMAALERHADVTVRFLEHYGQRPLTVFSEELRTI